MVSLYKLIEYFVTVLEQYISTIKDWVYRSKCTIPFSKSEYSLNVLLKHGLFYLMYLNLHEIRMECTLCT